MTSILSGRLLVSIAVVLIAVGANAFVAYEQIGVQGDARAIPDIVLRHAPRAGQFPMPPGPQQRSSVAVAAGAAAIGLHPYPFPMAINSQPYNGQPACNDCGFCSSCGGSDACGCCRTLQASRIRGHARGGPASPAARTR